MTRSDFLPNQPSISIAGRSKQPPPPTHGQSIKGQAPVARPPTPRNTPSDSSSTGLQIKRPTSTHHTSRSHEQTSTEQKIKGSSTHRTSQSTHEPIVHTIKGAAERHGRADHTEIGIKISSGKRTDTVSDASGIVITGRAQTGKRTWDAQVEQTDRVVKRRSLFGYQMARVQSQADAEPRHTPNEQPGKDTPSNQNDPNDIELDTPVTF